MSTPLEFYRNQALSARSNIPWVASLQSEALNDFVQKGFPTRHDEDWKYTTLDPLLQELFVEKNEPKASVYSFPFQHILLTGGTRLENLSLPEGVIIEPLEKALVSHADRIQSNLSSIQSPIHALNTAFLHQGFFIYIPRGVVIEKPLVLAHTGYEASHIRHVIVAEPDSQCTIIEDYSGESKYWTNTATDITLHTNARLIHFKIQRESKEAFHTGLVSVRQYENSYMESHSLSLGGKLVRSDTTVEFSGSHATCLLNGIYLPDEGQHIDHHTTVHHALPSCKSVEDYKGILMGRSHAVFNGKVLVAKDAQHTNASQNNKNLLLSKGAEIDTKPQLEIFADDVICTHGAAVGQLDEDALFYLTARGIDKEEARALLIHAFVRNNLEYVSEEPVAKWMAALIDEQLELPS